MKKSSIRKTWNVISSILVALVVLLALIVFVRKFKLYGDLADKVHAYIVDRERKRTDGE